MPCSSGKIEHPTRDAALGHVRDLEYKNSLHGNDDLSVGLQAYPCRECRQWHVGRRHVPTVWHYDTVAVLDAMTDTFVLTPEKTRRLPTHLRRQNSGPRLVRLLHLEEHASMVWFTWNEAWDFSGAPHPGVFVSRSVAKRPGEGVVRIGVPASVITLRWHDYVQRNGVPRAMAKAIAQIDRTEWLATEQAVPSRLVRSLEVWYRDRWVDAATLDDDYDAWLANG